MSNNSTFCISNQEQFEDALCWVSDLFKDVNGFRPRGYKFHTWSFQELTDFINDLKVNSANLIDIVLDVEDMFDIEIDNESMEQMLSVKQALEIIQKKMAI